MSEQSQVYFNTRYKHFSELGGSGSNLSQFSLLIEPIIHGHALIYWLSLRWEYYYVFRGYSWAITELTCCVSKSLDSQYISSQAFFCNSIDKKLQLRIFSWRNIPSQLWLYKYFHKYNRRKREVRTKIGRRTLIFPVQAQLHYSHTVLLAAPLQWYWAAKLQLLQYWCSYTTHSPHKWEFMSSGSEKMDCNLHGAAADILPIWGINRRFIQWSCFLQWLLTQLTRVL